MQFTSIELFCNSLAIPRNDPIRSILAEHEFLTGFFRKMGLMTARVNYLKTLLLDRFKTVPEFNDDYKNRIIEHYNKVIHQTNQSFSTIPIIPIQPNIPIKRPIAIRIAPPAIAVSPNHTDSEQFEDDPDKQILDIEIPELKSEDQLNDIFDLMIKMMKLRGKAHEQKGCMGRKFHNDRLIQKAIAEYNDIKDGPISVKWKAVVKYRTKCIEIQKNKVARTSHSDS